MYKEAGGSEIKRRITRAGIQNFLTILAQKQHSESTRTHNRRKTINSDPPSPLKNGRLFGYYTEYDLSGRPHGHNSRTSSLITLAIVIELA